ncbi:aldo/keto reductase [Marinicrinis lubricantis]|uniref:Aldo/keto reductase n=1 Tax=Marinicrinis lubricantis TaxID=2086470 RepID=A0ABW1INE4_9BACL
MNKIQIPGVEGGITQLIMGSDYFSPKRMELVSQMLDSFVENGGNTIDTAFIYCGGESEEAIGIWMQERGNRDQIKVWTKGAHPNASGPRVNPDAIREELEISLQRLQTDYVDLYALHRDDPNVPVQVIIDALNEHVEAGTIKAFGVSNWTVQRIQEANDYAKKNGLHGFTFNSPNLSLAKAQEPYWRDCISADDEILQWHTERNFPLLSWSSQARGFFTGRFTRDNLENKDLVRVFYNDANWERYDRAKTLAEEKGVSTIQIALAYVLNQPFPTCAIIGPQNPEEMRSCAEGAQIRLSKSEIAWLDLKQESR